MEILKKVNPNPTSGDITNANSSSQTSLAFDRYTLTHSYQLSLTLVQILMRVDKSFRYRGNIQSTPINSHATLVLV
jgi:hypothetical protein